jgi:hypothetical protein
MRAVIESEWAELAQAAAEETAGLALYCALNASAHSRSLAALRWCSSLIVGWCCARFPGP